MKLSILFLTCANNKEADKIAVVLLEKKLVFCVKKQPVSSSSLWKGKIESSDEILLIIESLEDNFKKIDKEVSKLHSYDTYVLMALPVTQTTKDVEDWVKDELEK